MSTLNANIDPEKWVAQLLLKYGIDNAPVPVDKIASWEGITVVVNADLGENVSGVLIIKNGKATIGCSKRDNQNRKRFTTAHELAHYFLHWNATYQPNEEVFVDRDFFMKFREFSTVSYDPIEMRQENEANAFAAALLMPKHLIEKELYNEDFIKLKDVDVIARLAKIFKVSNTAMTYRMTNLNLLF